MTTPAPNAPTLRTLVFEALNNAKANGYDNHDGNAVTVAVDILDRDADVYSHRHATVANVEELVEEWRSANPV